MSPVDPLRQIKDLRGKPLARPATLPPKRRAIAAAPVLVADLIPVEPVKGPPPTPPSPETAGALTELGRQRARDAAIREAKAKRNAGTNADRAEAAYQQRVAERADQELAEAQAAVAVIESTPVNDLSSSVLSPRTAEALDKAVEIALGEGLRFKVPLTPDQLFGSESEAARQVRENEEFRAAVEAMPSLSTAEYGATYAAGLESLRDLPSGGQSLHAAELAIELVAANKRADAAEQTVADGARVIAELAQKLVDAQRDATAALKRAEAADTRAGVARGEKLEAERLLDQAKRGAEVARERYENLSRDYAHLRGERDELLHHLASPPVHILPPASAERALVGTVGECRPVPATAASSPWPADGAVVVSHLDQRTGEARVEVEFAAGFGFRVARSHNSLEDGSAPCAAVAFHGSTQGEPRGIVALDRVRMIANRMLEAATLAEAMRDTPDAELATFILRGVAAAPVSAVAS